MVSRTGRSQPDATDTIDVNSLPLPMRRAYERCREADGPQHRPKGNGAHIYARVTSEEQAGPGKTSIAEQLRLCEAALAGTGIPIVATWVDEGFSGVSRLRDRPVGRELVAALKPGQIVVAFRLDRFSRNARLGLGRHQRTAAARRRTIHRRRSAVDSTGRQRRARPDLRVQFAAGHRHCATGTRLGRRPDSGWQACADPTRLLAI